MNAASCAVTLSDIPFHGPVGAVRIGLVNARLVVNPTYPEMQESQLNIMVVGTAEGIVMVESGAREVSEDRVLEAIDFAHEQIKKICAAISDLAKRAGKEKREVKAKEFDQPYYDALKAKVGGELSEALDIQPSTLVARMEKLRQPVAHRDSR